MQCIGRKQKANCKSVFVIKKWCRFDWRSEIVFRKMSAAYYTTRSIIKVSRSIRLVFSFVSVYTFIRFRRQTYSEKTRFTHDSQYSCSIQMSWIGVIWKLCSLFASFFLKKKDLPQWKQRCEINFYRSK